jgi:Kef-type K+ transport system membrane component KefB
LLLDIAELDDISSIILMALLFAVVPVLHAGARTSLFPLVLEEAGVLFLKLALFGGFCVFFSLYIEERLTSFFRNIEAVPASMLMVAGTGFIIAALAGILGFSVAIGAFFAGLVFSRDPTSVKIDASFAALYDLFSPFFFIGIGLNLQLGALSSSLGLGIILVAAAVVGKFVGTAGPALLGMGLSGATLLGISMIPRAEIAMVVMQRGLHLGEWAVPPEVFAGMVLVSAVTCIFGPLFVRRLLQRWPRGKVQT